MKPTQVVLLVFWALTLGLMTLPLWADHVRYSYPGVVVIMVAMCVLTALSGGFGEITRTTRTR